MVCADSALPMPEFRATPVCAPLGSPTTADRTSVTDRQSPARGMKDWSMVSVSATPTSSDSGALVSPVPVVPVLPMTTGALAQATSSGMLKPTNVMPTIPLVAPLGPGLTSPP